MKISENIKKIGLLGLIITMYGVFGSSVSIIANLGITGIIIAIVLSIILFIICLLLLRPILIKNNRGVTMLEAIQNVGLTDIESRNDHQQGLPPSKFIDLADHEIALSGISAYRTFDQHIIDIRQALVKGKRVYIIILHPESQEIQFISKKENRDIHGDIMQTITTIIREGFIKRPGFKIKFFSRLPPFTALMIDGDISPIGEKPQDDKGQIRVQPSFMHNTHHEGLIFQLKNKNTDGAFGYFADEFRHQWEEDSVEDNELFTE